MSFKSPNYTQVPNDLFDIHMREMGGSELKVVMAITRQTVGFHKEKAEYSIRKIMEMTGLSRNSVKNGAKKAQEHGLLKRTNPKTKASARWSLAIKHSKIDPSERSKIDPSNGQKLTHDPQKLPYSTDVKESIKEKEIKEEEEEGLFGNAYNFFLENFGAPRKYDHELLGDLTEEHTAHWVIEAMKIAVKRNARNLAYTEGILKRWKVEGYGKNNKQDQDNPSHSTQLPNPQQIELTLEKQKKNQPDKQSLRKHDQETICPECIDGYGIVSLGRAKDGNEYARQCKTCLSKRIIEQQEELQSISRMTAEEKSMRVDDIGTTSRPHTKKMMAAIQQFINNPVGMLTIHGSNGSGKSAALIIAVNECLEAGHPAIYIPAYDLLNWIQDAFKKNGDTRDGTALQRLNKLKNIKVLAIDEFQAVKLTDWRVEQLENLIDYRQRFGIDGTMGTLLAMNENPLTMPSHRIRSRITDGRNSPLVSPIILNNDPDIRSGLR